MTNDERTRAAERARAKKRSQDPGHQERRRRYIQKRMEEDPEGFRAYFRESQKKRRALPEGHPGTCDVCGVLPPPKKDGKRGINQDHRHDNNVVRGYLCHRCNLRMAVIDLRFLDPDAFRALLAYSCRGEPAVTVQPDRPRRRKRKRAEPDLFGYDQEKQGIKPAS